MDKNLSDKVARNVEDCMLSAVAWYEFEYGAARSLDSAKSNERLTLLRSVFPVVRAFGEDDATEAAFVRARLEALKPNAQPIGLHDVLLAGQALALGAALVQCADATQPDDDGPSWLCG